MCPGILQAIPHWVLVWLEDGSRGLKRASIQLSLFYIMGMTMNKTIETSYANNLSVLIHIESELVRATSWLRALGSLPEDHSQDTIAYWAGYRFTFLNIAFEEYHPLHLREVCASIRTLAVSINESDWHEGCRQAEFELETFNCA